MQEGPRACEPEDRPLRKALEIARRQWRVGGEHDPAQADLAPLLLGRRHHDTVDWVGALGDHDDRKPPAARFALGLDGGRDEHTFTVGQHVDRVGLQVHGPATGFTGDHRSCGGVPVPSRPKAGIHVRAAFSEADALSETGRGEGGFGSTGRG